jgi:aspartate racemase
VYFDRIAAGTRLPLVSIVDIARERARELGVRRALLLGTNATMTAAMYPEAFTEEGIDIVVPNEEERQFLNRSIYEDLAVGAVTAELRGRFLDLCRRHLDDSGVDAILMACTEIPLVLKDGDLPVPLIDTARCHAEAIFRRAGGRS